MLRMTVFAALALVLALAASACRKEAPPAEPAQEPVAAEEGSEPPAPAAKPAERVAHAPGTLPVPAPVAPPGPVEATAPAEGGVAPGAESPANGAAPTPPPVAPPPVAMPAPRPAMPDLRLLLTANDVSTLAGPKAQFHRSPLAGSTPGDDLDSLYWSPDKGNDFGFAIQVFRMRDAEAARERFSTMLASYPSATEIAPISGKTFFAYWDEVLFVTFVQPGKNFVYVLSCGRKFCDSDKLYELAKKVASRSS
jgi:hypothetical protein